MPDPSLRQRDALAALGVTSAGALHRHDCERDGDWAATVVARLIPIDGQGLDQRHIEDAAYGLHWLELALGLRFDLGRSLVPQLPLALLDAADATQAKGGCL